MTPRFKAGNEVRLKSQPDRAGRITAGPDLLQGEYWYTIYFGPGETGRHPESDLEAYSGTTDVLQLLRDGRFAGREAFSKLLTQLKLATSLRSHIYALQASRTTFYAYQFKPVLKFLESWKHRLLIADEVGMGKTIEAGLILTELRARLELARILIVPPAHLIAKWQQEMKRRFDLDFEILDRKRAWGFLARFQDEGDETRLKGILSLQTLRGRSLQDRWEAIGPTFNLVIFDEAGRLRNPGTLSHKAARLVSDTADALLLLTASPIQTGEEDLFHLLSLLDPDEFNSYEVYETRLDANAPILDALRVLRGGSRDDLRRCAEILKRLEETPYGVRVAENPLFRDVVRRLEDPATPTRSEIIELQRDLNSLNVFGHILSRTRKREVGEAQPLRQAATVPCHPAPDEIQFYDLVTNLCRSLYSRVRNNTLAAFATMMPQRQMASCMPAMIEYCRERLTTGDSAIDPVEGSDLHPEDYYGEDDDEAAPVIDWRQLGDLDDWRLKLERSDSKWAKLVEVLRRLEKEGPTRKIIVFSYFKKTLGYLQRRLQEIGISTLVISGDVRTSADDPEQDERGKRLERFRTDPAIRVLLSTEVGNEGLDLQFSHILINYDLPWNPMVVEQRIGRLDRIGQKSDKILIFNLTMPGTIEDLILQRLYQRIRIFERSIGDLEAILGEVVRNLTQDLFSADLTPGQREERVRQAAEVVEQRRKELEALEAKASALIGHDEFFTDEIRRALGQHRYVTGDGLLVFLRDFLTAHHPACGMEPGHAKDIFTLSVDEPLRLFVRAAIPSDDLGLRLFLRRSTSGLLDFTINPELAQDNPRLEFLTFHHPLVRAISQYYSKHPDELHPISLLRLSTKAVPAGIYFWFLYLTEITGARPAKELECVAVRSDDGTSLGPDEGETLLWEMLYRGSSVPAGERTGRAAPEDLVLKAEEVAVGRLNRRFSDHQRINEALVTSRLTALEEAFKRNLRIREERLRAAQERNREARYLRMLEGGIRTLRSDYETKHRTVEEGRKLGKSLSLRGAGMVEVLYG